LLTESGCAVAHYSPFAARLFHHDSFLANLYKIAILYPQP
jgi:hypothetical protein